MDFARGIKWLGCSIAISVAIWVTGNFELLWFLLIPALF